MHRHLSKMKTSISIVCVLCLVLSSGGEGKMHYLEWTVAGVSPYLDSAFEIELGDSIVFGCLPNRFSNILIHYNEDHFNNCDSTRDNVFGCRSTKCTVTNLGFCYGMSENITFEFTQSSATLVNLLSFDPDTEVYIVSYSDGNSLRSALNNLSYGGECLENLKLRVKISSLPSSSTHGHFPTTTTHGQSPTPNHATHGEEQQETDSINLDVVAIGGLNNGQVIQASYVTLVTMVLLALVLTNQERLHA